MLPRVKSSPVACVFRSQPLSNLDGDIGDPTLSGSEPPPLTTPSYPDRPPERDGELLLQQLFPSAFDLLQLPLQPPRLPVVAVARFRNLGLQGLDLLIVGLTLTRQSLPACFFVTDDLVVDVFPLFLLCLLRHAEFLGARM